VPGTFNEYLVIYNTKRAHQGRGMNGKTPLKVFVSGLPKPKRKKQNQKAA
jgi:hypothetical protein